MKHLIFWIFAVLLAILLGACVPAATPAPVENYSVNEEPTSAPVVEAPAQLAATEPPVAEAPVEPAATEPPVGPASMSLSIGNLNSTPPQDILNEIGYFGGLGGGDVFCVDHNYTSPVFLTVTDKGSGEVKNEGFELMGGVNFNLCGLPVVGENVTIRVELPDNTVRNYSATTEAVYGQNFGQLNFKFVSELNDPLGMYHFVFQGNNWSLEHSLAISAIARPSLILDGSQLILIKFQPRENVRLFVYKPIVETGKAQLIGWENVQVDGNGQLFIDGNYPDGAYVAIGEISGEIYFRYKGNWMGWEGLSSIVKP